VRPLPTPPTLSAAVSLVIESNREDGYTPTRFIQVTQEGFAPNLLAVCSRLINKGEILEWLERALASHPMLLTLEDFVCLRGTEWGFDAATIQMACARATHFDRIAGGTRYS
jgi:hypothetical protein